MKQVNMKFDQVTVDQLKTIAQAHERTATGMVRWLIRREAERLQVERGQPDNVALAIGQHIFNPDSNLP